MVFSLSVGFNELFFDGMCCFYRDCCESENACFSVCKPNVTD